jgi:hypothetical protein
VRYVQRYRASPIRVGEVISEDEHSVTISRGQRHVHVAAESVAVFAVVPFMVYLATRKELPDWARASSAIIAGGTLLIDGGLLLSYTRKGRNND